jgi:hypothetical protein
MITKLTQDASSSAPAAAIHHGLISRIARCTGRSAGTREQQRDSQHDEKSCGGGTPADARIERLAGGAFVRRSVGGDRWAVAMTT